MNWKVLVIVASTLLAVWFVHNDGKQVGLREGELELAQLRIDIADAKTKAGDAAKAHQNELNKALEQVKNEHLEAMGKLYSDAVSSRTESDGLRSKLKEVEDRLRKHSNSTAGTGFKLDPATKAAMVLSDMYSGCSAERSELAIAFDGAYERGRAVEAHYNKARGQ